MPVRSALTPGTPTPIRTVPDHIERPEYAWKPTVNEGHEPWVQNPETIEKMRIAGKIAANALVAVSYTHLTLPTNREV